MKAKFFVILLVLFINVPLFSRDIDLDRIYINSSSSIYKQIIQYKERLYSEIFSIEVDTGIIFSAWTGTDKILYIKEAGTLNIAYEYNMTNRKKKELHRFRGNITTAMLSHRGNILAVKTLYYSGAKPVAQNIYINIAINAIIQEPSLTMFRDMTFYPGSDYLLTLGSKGIYKFSPFLRTRELVIPEIKFNNMIEKGDSVSAHFSPDKTKVLMLSGGGGSYKGRLFTDSGTTIITGISSNLLFWIDNNRFAFRSGSAGNYSVKIYDVHKGKEQTLLNGTLNPDIHYSQDAEILTFLDNQIINIFHINKGKQIHTGIEGEEVYFSPDGSKFTSIYQGKLWITNINMVLRKGLEIRRSADAIATLYNKALNNKNIHENSYSKNYIKLKIKLYKDIVSGTK